MYKNEHTLRFASTFFAVRMAQQSDGPGGLLHLQKENNQTLEIPILQSYLLGCPWKLVTS